jgi:hypothetical protein
MDREGARGGRSSDEEEVVLSIKKWPYRDFGTPLTM